MKKRIIIIQILLLFKFALYGQSKFKIQLTSNYLIKNQDTIYKNKKVVFKISATNSKVNSGEKSLSKLSNNSNLIIQLRELHLLDTTLNFQVVTFKKIRGQNHLQSCTKMKTPLNYISDKNQMGGSFYINGIYYYHSYSVGRVIKLN